MDIVQYFKDLNTKGIPVPMMRDPKTGLGSVSLTLTFISFNVVVAGLIGKLTKYLGDVDLTNALWLFGICTSLYFGRSFKKGDMSVNEKKES